MIYSRLARDASNPRSSSTLQGVVADLLPPLMPAGPAWARLWVTAPTTRASHACAVGFRRLRHPGAGVATPARTTGRLQLPRGRMRLLLCSPSQIPLCSTCSLLLIYLVFDQEKETTLLLECTHFILKEVYGMIWTKGKSSPTFLDEKHQHHCKDCTSSRVICAYGLELGPFTTQERKGKASIKSLDHDLATNSVY